MISGVENLNFKCLFHDRKSFVAVRMILYKFTDCASSVSIKAIQIK